MNDAEIEQAVQEITNAFHHDGYERALEKLTLANQKLAPSQRLEFQDPAGGSPLGFFLYDAKTNQELKRWDKV
jgi:hypothetical protein